MPDTRENHYSQARVEADRLYLSGMVGRDEEFQPPGTGIEAQARQAFDNIERVLAEAGYRLADVSKVTSYLVNAQENYPDYERVWKEVFDTPPYPCHTAVGVDELVIDGFLVEIDAEVYLPNQGGDGSE